MGELENPFKSDKWDDLAFGYDVLDDDDDEVEIDCGIDRDGNCGSAGSEYCDFECPNGRRLKN